MTRGGVLGGMLRDIGGPFGIVSFKNCDKGIFKMKFEQSGEWMTNGRYK
jgi:hypothetical protein